MTANAMLVVWLFLPDGSVPVGEPDPVATAPPPERPVPASVSDRPPQKISQGEDARPREQPAMSVPTPATAPERITTTNPEVEVAPVAQRSQPAVVRTTLAELPAPARQRFPELSFSTHIYADDPELRAVVINGTRLTEGQTLNDVVVHEITEDGAVFAFEGYLVSVAVLAEWDASP